MGEKIYELLERRVSGVCFIEDFVEIHFGDAILRCLADPIIKQRGQSIAFLEKGFRDAICSMIGDRVEKLKLVEDKCIELGTKSGLTLTVPLDNKSKDLPESAHFLPAEGEPLEVY